MKKGYLFKNDLGKWEVGFVSDIDENGDVLYQTFAEYDTYGSAWAAMATEQIRGQ